MMRVVPKSGCFISSATKGNSTIPFATKASFRLRIESAFFVMECAMKMTTATLTSSEGWKLMGPNWIHRLAPFAVWPTPGISVRNTSIPATVQMRPT